MATTDRPPVFMAFACERVLTETDGVKSYLRVADELSAYQEEDAPELTAVINLTIVFGVRGGSVLGKHTMTMRLFDPDGEKAGPDIPFDYDFKHEYDKLTIEAPVSM